MTPSQAYQSLATHGREAAYLASTMGLLHWDQRTSIPVNGHAHRTNQLSFLAKMLHTMTTDLRISEWLAVVEGSELTRDPLSVEAVNVREWRRLYDRAIKIPERLAVELARAASEGQSAWEKARPENDWTRFKPYLKRLVALKREQAEAVGYEHEPYDALLDYYEQGETTRNLVPIFDQLLKSLVGLLELILGSARRRVTPLPRRVFPIARQEAFAKEVAQRIGFDLEGGRLDVSAHPFTQSVGPGDVRITTRYHARAFGDAFFSVVHEAGHAMYHQGLPLEHWGTPICRPVSLGVNESQSRMWENLVARSLPFWKHFYPEAQARFSALRGVSLDGFYCGINEVTPGLIRVAADEVTYNLHVLLRFEIEVLLARGELEVDDLPDAWNAKMRTYLGLTPPDFATGVMQDVHWSAGSIGYFPTYTLGNLNAAQFFRKAEDDLGDLGALFERGEFGELLQWLRENIHSQGSRYIPRELVRTVTGEELNPQYLIDYLERKYVEVYEISALA